MQRTTAAQLSQKQSMQPFLAVPKWHQVPSKCLHVHPALFWCSTSDGLCRVSALLCDIYSAQRQQELHHESLALLPTTWIARTHELLIA
jgi:hypothetical protein